MSEEKNWRDARLKKALDSAPDDGARPADAVREAILLKARLTAQAAAAPAAAQRSGWRAWPGLAALASVVLVLAGGWRVFDGARHEDGEAPPVLAQAPTPSAPAAVVVAQAEMEKEQRLPQQAQSRMARRRDPAPPRAASVPIGAPVEAPAEAPVVVAEAPASPPPPAWTMLRIATADGPVLLRREQLSAAAAEGLDHLLSTAPAAAAAEPAGKLALASRLADRRASVVAAVPSIELLRGSEALARVPLPASGPLREELDALLPVSAAKPASAPGPGH